MELIYRKADISDIDDLVDLKMKQTIYVCNREGLKLKSQDIARENIKNVLIQELNKTIYFFLAIDKSNNKAVACNGVIIHQMVLSALCLNGKNHI